MNDEFYIGYLDRSPSGLARHTRRVVGALVLLGSAVMITLAVVQRPVDSGKFEFGTVRSFEGVLYEFPIPILRVTLPEASTNEPAAMNLLLVGAGKHGLPAWARGQDGKKVRFRGTLIYRQNMTMVELNDAASFQVLGEPSAREMRGREEVVGEAAFTGELVDTKCYFGVMRPAVGKVHRACAVRCLSGGVPPGLLVRDAEGNAVVVMLAGSGGTPLNYDVQWAARLVHASGRLELHDRVPVLRVQRLELADAGKPWPGWRHSPVGP